MADSLNNININSNNKRYNVSSKISNKVNYLKSLNVDYNLPVYDDIIDYSSDVIIEELNNINNKSLDKISIFDGIYDSFKAMIKLKQSEFVFDQRTGLITKVIYPNGIIENNIYDDKGQLIKKEYFYNNNGKREPISIFGDYTRFKYFSDKTISEEQLKQYGGNQMDFRDNNLELLQDPYIKERLKMWYPNASTEDYQLLLAKICNVGCGYVAAVNTIFLQYEGREEEFEEKFGFPMYTVDINGNIDFNYEYLILDYVLSVYGPMGYSIEELYGNITLDTEDGALGDEDNSDGIIGGTNEETYIKFETFLKYVYGQKVDVSVHRSSEFISNWVPVDPNSWEYKYKQWEYFFKTGDFKWVTNPPAEICKEAVDINKIKEILSDNSKFTVICMYDFDLYSIDGKKILAEDVGSHAMTVVELTEIGIIVSSWGKKYLIRYEDINTDTFNRIVTYDYEEEK